MKIRFIGAAREVTGSKHLITTKDGRNILLDCGMFQGKGLETDGLNRKIGIDPSKIDHIILSHAHIDHSGLIPYVYKNGFRGTVICTHATRALCSLMLPDSGHIQESDVKWFNKKRARQGLPPVQPIYNQDDAVNFLKLFIGVPYELNYKVTDVVTVKFTNPGHLLGSGVINLEVEENGRIIKFAFTGDIGRPKNRILISPQPFPQCDYLLTESTYGNRLHPADPEAEQELLDIVKKTCVEKRGKLIIPSFAIGRTQEIVFTLNNFFNDCRLPKVDIYVDSPLSVNATDVFRQHTDCLNEDVKRVLETDPDPFGFNSLHYIKTVDESKALNDNPNPCVIISASGMMEAGRIKHHLANNISDEKNTVLIVGYCSPSSLGARLQQPGTTEVSIFGEKHEVKAEICKIEAFSGHGDYSEMINFIRCQDPSKMKKIFLVHGEYEAQKFYKTQLEAAGFHDIEIPEAGNEFEL
jgi:metallo-beta-lactamase family protein